MIFSKLGRSLSRSSRSINTLRAGNGGVLRSSAVINNIEGGFIDGRGGLGLLRGYLTSIGSRGTHNPFLSDLNSILANPRIRRFFSTEAPKKKNYENFYPKGKKELPKGEKQKSESKENSSNADHDESDFNKGTFMKAFYLLAPLFVVQLLFYPFSFGDGDKQQISFQEFKNRLLEPGLVDHIVVSNKSVAKVYVRSSAQNQTSDDIVQGPVNGVPARGRGGQHKYYFTIGSVDTFEEKLEEAQEALGIDPHNYVPVTYASEMVWYQELMRFAPTLLLLQGCIKVWDTRQRSCCNSFNAHEDYVSDMTFASDSMKLLSTSGDGTLSVCNLRSNKIQSQSEFSEEELLSVVIMKNGRKVICGSQNGTLLLYSWGFFKDCSDRFTGLSPNSIDALLKLDEDRVITGSENGLISLLGILPNRIIQPLAEHSEYPIEHLAFSHDRKFLGSISHDQVLKMWDLDDLLQNTVNAQNDQAAVSDSDSDEMDVDTKPPKSRKGAKRKNENANGTASSFFADL